LRDAGSKQKNERLARIADIFVAIACDIKSPNSLARWPRVDLWKYAFRPEDVARGHDGVREAYDRFLTTNFPLSAGFEAIEDKLGDVRAFRVSAKEVRSDNVVLHFHGGGFWLVRPRGRWNMRAGWQRQLTGFATPSTIDLRLSTLIRRRSTTPSPPIVHC
jgi:hypothetical protein